MRTSLPTKALLAAVILCSTVALSRGEGSNVSSVNSMTVVPSRIELGSLSFGNSEVALKQIRLIVSNLPSGFHLTDVDCSHCRGIRVKSWILDGEKAVLDFELNEKRFCEFEPFGAFIKRQIRLITDSPTEPQFVVPVIGWIAVNNSSRDFTQFVYQGALRWQGAWATPNVAGALMTGGILALLGSVAGLSTLRRDRPRLAWIGVSASMVALIVALSLLGMTYSRGAWLGFFAGCGIMSLCLPVLRRPVGLAAIGFLVVLTVLPSGLSRLGSYATVQDDLSIANRLKLWEGALQMMAEHPLHGVGSGRFQPEFEEQYQTFEHTAKTTSAVNDYLTLGAEYGLVVLGVTVGALISLVLQSIRVSIRAQSIMISTLTAMLVSFMVTSIFSTLWAAHAYRWLFLLNVLVLSACIMVFEVRRAEIRWPVRRMLCSLSTCTLGTLCALTLISAVSLLFLPTKNYGFELPYQGASHIFPGCEPRWQTSHGTILYVTDCAHQELLFHSTIRPMAALGWKVIPVPETTSPATIDELIGHLHRSFPQSPLFLAGESKGGRIAWKIASQAHKGSVKAGGGYNFLTSDLQVITLPDESPPPFLVYQSLYSDGISSNAAIRAQNQSAFQGLPLKVVLSQDTANHFSEGWMRYLVTLSKFFVNENLGKH